MVLILDTTIGFSILLPFTIGKSTALLAVRFYRSHPPRSLTNTFVVEPTTDDPTGSFADSRDPIRYRSYRGRGWARASDRVHRTAASNL